jgi:chromosome segregation ATPase
MRAEDCFWLLKEKEKEIERLKEQIARDDHTVPQLQVEIERIRLECNSKCLFLKSDKKEIDRLRKDNKWLLEQHEKPNTDIIQQKDREIERLKLELEDYRTKTPHWNKDWWQYSNEVSDLRKEIERLKKVNNKFELLLAEKNKKLVSLVNEREQMKKKIKSDMGCWMRIEQVLEYIEDMGEKVWIGRPSIEEIKKILEGKG